MVVVRARSDVPGVLRIRLEHHRKTVADVLAVVADRAPCAWRPCADVVFCPDGGSAAHADELISEALAEHPGAEAAVCAFPRGCAIGVPGTAARRWYRRSSAPGAWERRTRSVAAGDGQFGRSWISDGGVQGASLGEVVASFLVTASVSLELPERGQ